MCDVMFVVFVCFHLELRIRFCITWDVQSPITSAWKIGKLGSTWQVINARKTLQLLRHSCSDLFPQIAIAIGVLTANRGGGRRTTLADWTWHQGAIAGCSGRGIVGCHRKVPLHSAMVGGEGDDQLWGSGRGAIAGCHCSVLWLGVRVTTNFGGVDVVPLLGAIAGCHCSVLWLGGGIFSLHWQHKNCFCYLGSMLV